MWPTIVLCSTLSLLIAEKPDSGYRLPKGTRAIAFDLHKDERIPDGAVPGMEVDIVGEISEPIKTGVAILKVKLLAVDPKFEGKEQTVVVQLTQAQEDALALMQKHGMRLGIRLRERGK